MTSTQTGEEAFSIQRDVRTTWRRFLDAIVPLRPSLHRYCCRLTGNVWDGEDLMQDTFLRVFALLGKIDADLQNPRAYLIRCATNLWIDQQRRQHRDARFRTQSKQDEVAAANDNASRETELHEAANELLTELPPRERAALVMRDVLDLGAEESAALLGVSVSAVKSALHRGRNRLDAEAVPIRRVASEAMAQRLLDALAANDLAALRSICSADIQVELVGGAQMENFEQSRTFFAHAHWVFPAGMEHIAKAMGFGTDPRWRLHDYQGETVVLGTRRLGGKTVLNEIHRLEEDDGRIVRVRSYCFTPETLSAVAQRVGLPAAPKPHRSPDPRE